MTDLQAAAAVCGDDLVEIRIRLRGEIAALRAADDAADHRTFATLRRFGVAAWRAHGGLADGLFDDLTDCLRTPVG